MESKRSEIQQAQEKDNEDEAMQLLLSALASVRNVSKKVHYGSRRRDRNIASQNEWMNLRRRRRHHSHHCQYTQWKTEQKNFLMTNNDEAIFGKLEYRTCMTCQQKLGEMNIQLIREQINQLE
jgi:hypothetical protein